MSAKTRLWLQSDGGIDDDSKTVGSVTWCDWQANTTDTEYVRADLCTPTDERVRALVSLMPETLASLDATGCNVSLANDIRAALRDMEGGKP